MRRGSRAVLLGLLLGGLAGCGDDGGTAATSTTSLETGVTFEGTVTVPTTPSGSVATTEVTAPPSDEVTTTPGAVPEAFPDDFPVPRRAEVDLGSVGRAEGELRAAVDLTVPGTPPTEVLDFYRNAIDDAGWSVLLDDHDGRDEDFVGQLVFETDAYVGNVLAASDGAGSTLLTLTATLPD